jgi:hypothetical protein
VGLDRYKDELVAADLKCNLLVFGGPREELEPQEVAELKAWLAAGGRALVLLADQSDREQRTQLRGLLEEYVYVDALYSYMMLRRIFICKFLISPVFVQSKVRHSP